MAPGGRVLGDFWVSGRAGDIQFLPSTANYLFEIISFPLYIPKEGFLRLDRGLDWYLAINGVYYGPRRSRSGRFLSFWAGWWYIILTKVKSTTYLKSFHFLCTYPRKLFSAWTEVWTGTWPSTASITVFICKISEQICGFWAGWWFIILTNCGQILTSNHVSTFVHCQWIMLALGSRFGLLLVLQRRLLWFPEAIRVSQSSWSKLQVSVRRPASFSSHVFSGRPSPPQAVQ